MKPTLSLILAALSCGLCFAAAQKASPGFTSAKPNLLVIVADDLGYADVGFNGGKVIATPNLDRLVASGINLTDFRACPMCSPTRAGLLTGRWPLRFGLMRSVVPPWSTNGLTHQEKTLPELLAPAGYEQRVIMGKWHLGHARREFLPLAHGFTAYYGHYNGAIDYFKHTREGENDWHRDDRSVREEGYSTDLLGAEAARFIGEAPAGKPWFLYLPFNAPHAPFQAKAEDLQKYPQFKLAERRAYAAMVDSLDQAIGRVLAALQGRPDATNTLVLFFSDNGGVLKAGSSNRPWRGGKLTVYEGGTRVCAAIWWPAGGLTGGGHFAGRIGYIDVLPTLLAAAGERLPRNLDGLNFLPALHGQPLSPRLWFSYMHQSEEALASVHDGPWKLIAEGDFFATKPDAAPKLQLYNLQTDAGETTDLAGGHPDIVARLQAELRRFGALQKPGGVGYDTGREGFKAPKDWVIER
jgi:arylsulfatase B